MGRPPTGREGMITQSTVSYTPKAFQIQSLQDSACYSICSGFLDLARTEITTEISEGGAGLIRMT